VGQTASCTPWRITDPYIAYRQGEAGGGGHNRGKIIREISYQAPLDGNDSVTDMRRCFRRSWKNYWKRTSMATPGAETLITIRRWRTQNRTELGKYAEQKKSSNRRTGAMIALSAHRPGAGLATTQL
jgi:hypothetical protein